jgi:hypothetical protein
MLDYASIAWSWCWVRGRVACRSDRPSAAIFTRDPPSLEHIQAGRHRRHHRPNRSSLRRPTSNLTDGDGLSVSRFAHAPQQRRGVSAVTFFAGAGWVRLLVGPGSWRRPSSRGGCSSAGPRSGRRMGSGRRLCPPSIVRSDPAIPRTSTPARRLPPHRSRPRRRPIPIPTARGRAASC